MGEIWYMDREQKGIFYSGWDAEQVYDGYKKHHLNPGSSKYGAVLKSTKRIHVGWIFKVRINFRFIHRYSWLWIPDVRWKYGERRFHWLFFNFWLEKEYMTVGAAVIKDHLKEAQHG